MSIELVVLRGDGIASEILNEALKILNFISEVGLAKVEYRIYDVGAGYYLKTGKVISDEAVEDIKRTRLVLKTPTGLPDVRYEDGTEVGMISSYLIRPMLRLYANIRPIKLFPNIPKLLYNINNIDYIIVRENLEGILATRGRGIVLWDEVAIDNIVITRFESYRVFKLAFELARESSGTPSERVRKVTIVDKSNVLKSFAFFRRIFNEVAKDYPDIKTEYLYSDSAVVKLLKEPDDLNIIVTENFIGDYLSNLGATTVGGLGMVPSTNIGSDAAMFEPIHGSAPDIAGMNIANPIALILCLALLFKWVGRKELHDLIYKAVEYTLNEGFKTPDIGGFNKTYEVGDRILSNLDRILEKK